MDVIYNFTYTCHLVVTNEFTCYLFNITNIHTRNFSIQLKQVEDYWVILKLISLHRLINNLRKKKLILRVGKAQDHRDQPNELQG